MIVVSSAVTLLCGCTAVRTHVTPEGDTVLGRKNVTVQVPTRGLTILESRVGGLLVDPYVFAWSEATGIALSAELEKAPAGDCREFYWRRLLAIPGFKPENVRRGTRGRFQVIEYSLLAESPDPRFAGIRIDQRNVVGCVNVGGTTAFLHVSKVKYGEEDEKLFTQLFEQARVESH